MIECVPNISEGRDQTTLGYLGEAVERGEVAKRIARESREASGGLPAVRALGVFLASRGLAQVTMNLLDYRRTPPCVAAEWVQHEADRERVAVLEYELVGCAPADQFDGWPPHLPVVAGLSRRSYSTHSCSRQWNTPETDQALGYIPVFPHQPPIP
jgi:glutamate formiminotransferase